MNLDDKLNIIINESEKYQWMKNKEGGQTFGNQNEIREFSEDIFNLIRPNLKKELKNLSYEEYKHKFPGVEAALFIKIQGKGNWKLQKVGSWKELKPEPDNPKWVKKVSDFKSKDAKLHGNTADSDI